MVILLTLLPYLMIIYFKIGCSNIVAITVNVVITVSLV